MEPSRMDTLMRVQTVLVALVLAAATLPAAAGPTVTPYGTRSTITVIKPEFTRPGGQPGAVREIAPAKPKAVRRGRTPTTQP
jgi:hypothetical protein